MDYIVGTHGKTEETHGNTETHPYPSSNLIVHHVLCLSFSTLGVAKDLVLYPQLHSWSSSILALHLHAPTSGYSVMLCREEPRG